jgi:hypothetical protein
MAGDAKWLLTPWRYEGGAIVGANGNVIATVDQSRSQPHANGAALAAAPDLYTALETLLSTSALMEPREYTEAASAGRAALARARGEQP